MKRRMEVRGEAAGVTVLDDFAHHPTAIGGNDPRDSREISAAAVVGVVRAAQQHDAPQRVPARTGRVAGAGRRRVHLARGPAAGIGGERAAESRGDRRAIAQPRQDGGVLGRAPTTLSTNSCRSLRDDDVVAVFSNGKFDGIHDKLLARLRQTA